MPELMPCKRHPSVETRLRCVTCGDPICPRCAVQAPVGQKCPADAKQARSARALGTPKQVAKAIAASALTAGAGGTVLGLLFGSFGGFLLLLATYFAGQGLGHVVQRAAEGNGAPRFRTIAMVGAGAMVAVLWLVGFGVLVPRGISALSYATATYGAYQRFPG